MDAPNSFPGAEWYAHTPECRWLNVRQIVDEVCASLARRFVEQRIEAVTDVPRYLAATADRDMLRAAVLNLVVNAVEAMPRGGKLVITSYIGRNGLELEVADSGPGLSDEAQQSLRTPIHNQAGQGRRGTGDRARNRQSSWRRRRGSKLSRRRRGVYLAISSDRFQGGGLKVHDAGARHDQKCRRQAVA